MMYDCCCEVESTKNRFEEVAPEEPSKEPLKVILQGLGKLLNETHAILGDVESDLIGPRSDTEGETPRPYSMIDYSRQLMELALQVNFQAKHIKDAVGS